MKFYRIKIIYPHGIKKIDKTFSFTNGIILKNFRKYFEKDKYISFIEGFNKEDSLIYCEHVGGCWYRNYYNRWGKLIFKKDTYGLFILDNEEYKKYCQKRRQTILNKALKQIEEKNK
jgi:hypothetical protein